MIPNFDPLRRFLHSDPPSASLPNVVVTYTNLFLDFCLQSSLNGSASNLPDGAGRSCATSFSGQSGVASPVFHHSGSIQGLHNIHGSFNVPTMPNTLASRNSTINGVPTGAAQQPLASLSSGRFASNNLPVALTQLSQGSSHGHIGVNNSGGINVVGNPGFSSSTNGVAGSIPGILPTSAASGNRNTVPGLGVSPILGNAGSRITSSMGNMVGGGNIGRISSGGLSPGLASRLNLSGNTGSGGLGVQGQNRLISGVLPQAGFTGNTFAKVSCGRLLEMPLWLPCLLLSPCGLVLQIGHGSGGEVSAICRGEVQEQVARSPQVISMLGNSYPSAGGPLSRSHVQTVNNMNSIGVLNDMNSGDSSPFDINDFPQLTSRPGSAGGPQGQLGSLQKQGLGLSPVVQQNQEFSIQNEDFPALPGFKGCNSDFAMEMYQKEQLHDNAASMMQSQHFSMGRSAGLSLGSSYPSHRTQQQQQQQHAPSVVNNQDLHHLHGSDIFPSSHSLYHSQTSGGPPGIGPRRLNSPNSVSGMSSYEQLIQQYQRHQNQSQFRLQQMSAANQSFRDQGMKSMQTIQSSPDPFGALGLFSVVHISDPDLKYLAHGIDLTTLGLNLNSSENLYKTFQSPWSEDPAKGDPEFSVLQCYYAKQPPALHQGYFSKFTVETLFYIFYSMPRDEAQLYAANELTTINKAGLLLAATNEDNFVLHYELVEKRPALPPH
ncbi:hypothetical protein Fmac_019670 [Flemingia macrophylla]|uniref:NOT2/NOT3/NOT5 C-terminal domain-containing protein n=1 Tax=Flemingia macrophylla TaxID=520843 RepID=A0ABD1M8L2_9FABA